MKSDRTEFRSKRRWWATLAIVVAQNEKLFLMCYGFQTRSHVGSCATIRILNIEHQYTFNIYRYCTRHTLASRAVCIDNFCVWKCISGRFIVFSPLPWHGNWVSYACCVCVHGRTYKKTTSTNNILIVWIHHTVKRTQIRSEQKQ